MKFKEFLKTFFVNVKEGISRFLTAFISTVLFFLTVSYAIISETNRDEIIVPLCMTFGLIAVLSVLIKTYREYIGSKLNDIIQYIVCAVVGVISFILIKINYESLYLIMAYTGIIIALICFIFFILMRGENKDTVFPKLVSSCIFSGAVCCVLSGGLSTCIAAFQSLIFNWDEIAKLYLIVNLFVWVIGFINIFLSFIPKKDIPLAQSKIFRIFVLFAGLPLYILLIAILLIYLAKIVITWNMPVGEINWFASFASLFFIFFLLSVTQYKEKIARLFVKYGGYFLIPVLIMQAIAVFERINAYGLTTPRTVSLVLIVISILFILSSLLMPRHINKVALISGIIVLIVTVTPLNVIDMPIKSQTNILKTVLIKNDMLKDNKVIPNENVSDKDAERIISSYEYLKYNAKKVPEFIEDSKKTTQEIFGVTYKEKTDNHVYCTFQTKETLLDITEYKSIQKINGIDYIKIEQNGTIKEIDLKEIARKLYEKYRGDKQDLDLYIVDENTALYISDFYVTVIDDDISRCSLYGYALLKN